jgi:23S rRNA (pseudouridine1915-N3)-methyltransferase
MKIKVAAIGRMKAGPEREIAERLKSRADTAGRKIGLSFDSREFQESRSGSATVRKDEEAAALIGTLSPKSLLIALDEHGQTLDSRAFAEKLRKWRDQGAEELVFAIGGADGHGKAVLDRTELTLAFGLMTWPHQLARLMLWEQLYRAVTILSGHPYHRD